jgi:uncharacterized membrane-anchored protein
MTRSDTAAVNKIAEITLIFWIIKIIATTLGETTGDLVAQTLDLGYVVGLGITGLFLAVVLFFQIRAKRYHPALFWAAIVGTTTAGTEVSDFLDRTLNVGYFRGSIILTAGLLATFAIWKRRRGSLSVDRIADHDTELMFWIAVTFSNSLGTAFGDWLVDGVGLSYLGGAAVCMAVIALVLVAHRARSVNKVALFWLAFIFTRPFGATFGDLLTKPAGKGGLDLGTYNASAVCLALIAGLIMVQAWQRRTPRIA